MRGIRFLLAVGAALVLGGCGVGEFEEYSSKDGGFKVLMPGTPKVQTQSVPGGNVTSHGVEVSNGAYGVNVCALQIPGGNTAGREEMILEVGCNGAISHLRGKLTKSSEIKLDGKYPGRELLADLPEKKGVMRMRAYLVGTRIYQVMVVGKPDFVSTADADKFLDSFALTR